MSDYASPSKTRLWLDGDAFRAPAGTALPADIFASALAGWDAFGGIKAGFSRETSQDNTNLTIWNKKGTYRQKKGEKTETIKLRPVDVSKATALTLLQGGSIAETSTGSGIWEWIEGTDENFAFICRVQDGSEWKAFYLKKSTLANKPPETMDGEDLEGWDIEIIDLVPDDGSLSIRKFTSSNPLA
ncbi:hypothetical protein L3Q65_46140 [Amycolatopsis sp. FU40]|uniref:phage tail tube protein n=1 Tax=Amycolatopsis sp. FU40 TaxID=2914159 RepID=UPI001F460DB6|nr:hypothetical protein [Amycolatopsis sp. FU40]UKD55156.1 hypothetical protein L3Q65_46140 [Amycolatopsis sp. FU40]